MDGAAERRRREREFEIGNRREDGNIALWRRRPLDGIGDGLAEIASRWVCIGVFEDFAHALAEIRRLRPAKERAA